MSHNSGIVARPQSHIINILRSTRDHHPNFALLLGAGASVTSGVPDAASLIAVWRARHHTVYGQGKTLEEYLAQQPWYNAPEEYSLLFELLYDQPTQRRELIESCVAGASPSWGYIYLVNALRLNVFNTVFTTNFDDLLNEACYTFSHEVRPVVCAHDSSIRTLRVTSRRQKIIKLHGDFLFDNIKNTVRELESLEQNMREKFGQYATEFGLVVIGYSGRDRSIMDALGSMLRRDNSFPHGVYWGIRKDTVPSAALTALTRFPRFSAFELEGFDEFFADLNQELGLPLQREMADPYGALADRLNSLMASARIPTEGRSHPVIARDIQAIGDAVRRVVKPRQEEDAMDDTESASAQNDGGRELPLEFLAQTERRRGNYSAALSLLIQQLIKQPSMRLFGEAFDIILQQRLFEQMPRILELMRATRPALTKELSEANGISLKLINAGQYDAADQVLDISADTVGDTATTSKDSIYVLNKLQIKRHRGIALTQHEKSVLERMRQDPSKLIRMGADIILGLEGEAQALIAELLESREIVAKNFDEWPIFKLLSVREPRPVIVDVGTLGGELAKAESDSHVGEVIVPKKRNRPVRRGG